MLVNKLDLLANRSVMHCFLHVHLENNSVMWDLFIVNEQFHFLSFDATSHPYCKLAILDLQKRDIKQRSRETKSLTVAR